MYFEMPTINYKYYNSYRYQFAYGLSCHGNSENALIKVDMNDLTTREWYQANMYPQEGIFVPNLDSSTEDDLF
ncbi:carotenoid oxygenase family protein [Bathymodiolus japonicus methanotrophic gill symbiont]|uniref:carotenoid oxygenase family protein n=1 Tax=Bathymodiolus japonicus methanotrophic gill symbiont TaxID=113269 RepID=UPI003B82FB6D